MGLPGGFLLKVGDGLEYWNRGSYNEWRQGEERRKRKGRGGREEEKEEGEEGKMCNIR